MIEFYEIKKSFGDRVILNGVSLTVRPGEVLFIIGKSGAGKSVLTKHLVGLIRPDSGRIIFEGQDVARWSERQFYDLRRRCTMVLQHSTLLDSMTVLENVALPIRKHQGATESESLVQARAYLEQVGMTAFASRYPAALGDGLKKRVAIARALTLSPQYVIFDEPTTGLDPVSAVQVDRLIRYLADDLGVTCIVVSHDLRSIFSVADRAVMLYQGRVRLDGPPQLFRQTDDAVVRQFVNGHPDGPMEL